MRRMLLAFGATLHHIAVNHENPIFFSVGDDNALGGDYRTVKLFSVGDADAQQQPLYKAVQNGDAPLVKALLAVGVEIYGWDPYTDEPHSALDLAAFHGRIDVVRVLIAAGATPSDESIWAETPLDNAAGQGHVDVVRLLLEAGADGSTSSALCAAVQRGHPSAIQVLLDAGEDVSSDASSLIEVAVENGRRNCLGPLLRAGATFDDELYGAFRNPTEEQASALRYLERVQDAGGYDQLVQKYRRVLTAPRSCLSWYLRFHCEIRFSLGAFPTDLTKLVLEFWKPPGGL